MTRLSEKRDVQDQLINNLIGIDWHYLPPGDVVTARDADEHEAFLPEIARQQLIALNPGLVTANNLDDILRRLKIVKPNLAGNEHFLKALRGQWTVFQPAEKRERNLTLIDFDSPDRNHFAFTQELCFEDYDRRRMDMVLFVNGFPVVVIENKSPTLPEAELEAFDQVHFTYTDRIPGFLKFVQLFAACDIRLHYGPTWNDSLKAFYRWKVDGKDYGLERLSQSLFDHAHLLGMLRDLGRRTEGDDAGFLLAPPSRRGLRAPAARECSRPSIHSLTIDTIVV